MSLKDGTSSTTITGPFRLVRRGSYQLVPSSIRYMLCKTMILDHALDIQVFKGYQVIGFDQGQG